MTAENLIDQSRLIPTNNALVPEYSTHWTHLSTAKRWLGEQKGRGMAFFSLRRFPRRASRECQQARGSVWGVVVWPYMESLITRAGCDACKTSIHAKHEAKQHTLVCCTQTCAVLWCGVCTEQAHVLLCTMCMVWRLIHPPPPLHTHTPSQSWCGPVHVQNKHAHCCALCVHYSVCAAQLASILINSAVCMYACIPTLCAAYKCSTLLCV